MEHFPKTLELLKLTGEGLIAFALIMAWVSFCWRISRGEEWGIAVMIAGPFVLLLAVVFVRELLGC